MKWNDKKSKRILLAAGILAVVICLYVISTIPGNGKTVTADMASAADAGRSEMTAVQSATIAGRSGTGIGAADRPGAGNAAQRAGWAVRYGFQVYYDQGAPVRNQWVGDYYLGENGVLVKNAFIFYQGLLYHAGKSGACDRGRFYDGDREYYANQEGALHVSDWVLDGEDWVYVDEAGLVLKNDITPDGYLMDSEGKIIDDGYSDYEGFRYSDKNLRLNVGAADLIWKYLKKKGWTDTALAGMLGNFQQESHLSPSLVESNGIGYGLGQWSFERRTALENYAVSLGKPVNDMYMQLDYLTVEQAEGAYVRQYMKTDFSSAAEAAIAWCNNWERPNKMKARLGTVRIPYAMAYYEHYVNGADYLTTAYVYEEPEYLDEEDLEAADELKAAEAEYTPLTDADGNPTIGWIYDAGGWWYRYADCSYAQEEWKMIDGEWYYFGPDGYMEKGKWITDKAGRNYELDEAWHIITQKAAEGTATSSVIVAGVKMATASDAAAK